MPRWRGTRIGPLSVRGSRQRFRSQPLLRGGAACASPSHAGSKRELGNPSQRASMPAGSVFFGVR